MAVATATVAASADDGYGFPTTAFNIIDATAFFGNDGDAVHAFWRLTLTDDLVNATVSAATLTGTLDGTGDIVTVDIFGVDSDDPAAPTDWTSLEALPKTTASVAFTVGVDESGAVTTPDLTAIIQELIDSYGPLDTEHIMLVFDPDGQSATGAKEMHTFDDADAPILTITYTTGQSETTSGIINSGGGLTATTVSYDSQILRPASTITAGGWDTGPTTGQNLHDYAGDDTDATYIEDTTA